TTLRHDVEGSDDLMQPAALQGVATPLRADVRGAFDDVDLTLVDDENARPAHHTAPAVELAALGLRCPILSYVDDAVDARLELAGDFVDEGFQLLQRTPRVAVLAEPHRRCFLVEVLDAASLLVRDVDELAVPVPRSDEVGDADGDVVVLDFQVVGQA